MRSKKKFLLFVAFIIISLIIAFSSFFFSSIQSYVTSFISLNPNLANLILVVIYTTALTFSFSVTIVTGIGVLFFSAPAIIIYSLIGIVISSTIQFYISRRLGRDYIKDYIEKKGGRLEKFEEIFEKNPFKQILILNLIYFIPPTIPNFLGGIVKIKFKNFIIATFIGNLLDTIFVVYIIQGIVDFNIVQVYISAITLALITLIALYFYRGEIKELLFIGFPFLRRFSSKNN